MGRTQWARTRTDARGGGVGGEMFDSGSVRAATQFLIFWWTWERDIGFEKLLPKVLTAW